MRRRTVSLLGMDVPLGDNCPVCARPTILIRQEPMPDRPGKLKRRFVCPACNTVAVVEDRPEQPSIAAANEDAD